MHCLKSDVLDSVSDEDENDKETFKLDSLVDFYNAYETRDSQLVHMIEGLDNLLGIFQCLKKTLSDRHF